MYVGGICTGMQMSVEVRDIGSPGAVTTGNCELPYVDVGSSSLLEEQYSLLALQLSLQPQYCCY